ncbi:metallophosphoesterase [Rheinheimera sp. 4Y26]|uniref:metallophosphoesterase n=1 Tax=Rheinheimera sp. 4Y26 TaxID=2977811 RepID=UPI0021B0DA32|nr:metallophosphoesterase [Rheinheimera sp. 4Y26]MCT6698876.1 metallophosphoesterase [Rheinheimera sp. 4Y26]
MLLSYTFAPQATYRLLQLSDCHLLADKQGEYQHIQPYQHLKQLLLRYPATNFDAVILTGDLTQDHSLASYQHLAELLHNWQQNKATPVFYLPGNHDDPALMTQAFSKAPFYHHSWLNLQGWTLGLLNTKGPTPAGEFDATRRSALALQLNQLSTPVWLFCHHQAAPVGSFIDTLGLQQPELFWQLLAQYPQVKGLAHGHCHYAYQRLFHLPQAGDRQLQIVGCPATSVQFKQTADWQTEDLGPQACVWTFSAGEIPAVSWEFIGL